MLLLYSWPEGHIFCVPVAQLYRASDSDSEGRGLESRRAHHKDIDPAGHTMFWEIRYHKGDNMYCAKCGAEIGNARYCPVCGEKQPEPEYRQAAAGPNVSIFDDAQPQGQMGAVADLLTTVFRDPMYLIITILITVSCIGSSITLSRQDVSTGVNISVSVFPILFAVALWMCFVSAKSSNGLSPAGLSFASGLVKAQMIIMWIAFGIIVIGGIMTIVLGPSIADRIDFYGWGSGTDGFPSLPPEVLEELKELGIDEARALVISKAAIIGIGIALLFGAVIILIINVCFYRKLHMFTKSLCTSLKTDVYEVRKARASKNWLIVSAVFTLLCSGLPGLASAIGSAIRTGGSSAVVTISVTGVIANVCTAVACILASVLIGKYFADERY